MACFLFPCRELCPSKNGSSYEMIQTSSAYDFRVGLTPVEQPVRLMAHAHLSLMSLWRKTTKTDGCEQNSHKSQKISWAQQPTCIWHRFACIKLDPFGVHCIDMGTFLSRTAYSKVVPSRSDRRNDQLMLLRNLGMQRRFFSRVAWRCCTNAGRS